MKAKSKMTDEELDRLLVEKMADYEDRHTFKVEMKYGNTYVFCPEYDYITQLLIAKIENLLDLMNVEYYIQPKFGHNDFSFVFKGENQDLANYIRKFIEDGYRLKWN